MKFFKLFILTSLLLIPTISFAWKWYNLTSIGWDEDTWRTNCPSWYNLLSNIASQSVARSGNAGCYMPDNSAPSITASWYSNDTWVNTDKVIVSVSISDNESWISSMFYTINWDRFDASSSFNIELTDEWKYEIHIEATDNATIDGNNWSSVDPYTSTKDIIVKIDRTAPTFTSWTNPSNNWINSGPTVSYTISDLYKWEEILSKSFTCNNKPSNSEYIYPSVWGVVNWTCNPNTETNCNIDSNYSPNSSDCSWDCYDLYTKDDWVCHLSYERLDCNDLSLVVPEKLYYYNFDNQLIEESNTSENIITWNSPTWISLDWKFTSYYQTESNTYSPTLNDCSFRCNNWYHYETSQAGKCINDVKIICCNTTPLSIIPADWWVDNNEANDPNICDGKKNILAEWSLSSEVWSYNDWNNNYFNVASTACGYEKVPNSDWYTCNPGYYLTWSEAPDNLACTPVPTWEYSWQENEKHSCTNAPSNSTYTSNWTNNDCSWSCNDWYEPQGDSCYESAIKINCENIPLTSNWKERYLTWTYNLTNNTCHIKPQFSSYFFTNNGFSAWDIYDPSNSWWWRVNNGIAPWRVVSKSDSATKNRTVLAMCKNLWFDNYETYTEKIMRNSCWWWITLTRVHDTQDTLKRTYEQKCNTNLDSFDSITCK